MFCCHAFTQTNEARRKGALSLCSWNWVAPSYSPERDVQQDLCYDGCDCEDEESCQAIHCPSCKRQGPSDLFKLSFQKEALRLAAQRRRSGQRAPCKWERRPNAAKRQAAWSPAF